MKFGIVVVFNTTESIPLKEQLINMLNSLNDVCFCLVDNSNKEKTANYLNEIADKCNNTNVINIKKGKSFNSAIRAGARFMFNRHNLEHLGYINNSRNIQLIEVIKFFKNNRKEIIDMVTQEQNKKTIKQTLFQRVFSIEEYLIDLKALI